jgi:hypothetical protein
MEITARKLADILGGAVLGDADVKVVKPAKIDDATSDSVSYCKFKI